jgi:hypothetical protein
MLLLTYSKLPQKYWTEAVLCSSYVKNRTLTKSTGRTPYEIFHGSIPSVTDLRVFGEIAYAHRTKPSQSKPKFHGQKN